MKSLENTSKMKRELTYWKRWYCKDNLDFCGFGISRTMDCGYTAVTKMEKTTIQKTSVDIEKVV